MPVAAIYHTGLSEQTLIQWEAGTGGTGTGFGNGNEFQYCVNSGTNSGLLTQYDLPWPYSGNPGFANPIWTMPPGDVDRRLFIGSAPGPISVAAATLCKASVRSRPLLRQMGH